MSPYNLNSELQFRQITNRFEIVHLEVNTKSVIFRVGKETGSVGGKNRANIPLEGKWLDSGRGPRFCHFVICYNRLPVTTFSTDCYNFVTHLSRLGNKEKGKGKSKREKKGDKQKGKHKTQSEKVAIILSASIYRFPTKPCFR